MSTIDLTVLGILLKSSMNAHQIVKFVRDRGVSKMIKISSPAIYKSCKRLYKLGNLDGEVMRDGEAPQKIVYTVNKEGKEYFTRLMENYSSDLKPFYIDFNSFIWNIETLEKEEALLMLKNLREQIWQTREWIIAHENDVKDSDLPFSAKSIVKQYRMMFMTLSVWIDETITEFKAS